MKEYDVSIIVPVFNREKLIKPCIESINAQTYDRAKWEVCFVDDASTDKSVEVIESLIDKEINYKIIKRTVGSGNASAPRNDGIKASLGKYIFFLDSDDYIDSELLENAMEMATRNNSDIVYIKLLALGTRSKTIRPFRKKIVEKADIIKDHLMRSLKIFKLFKSKMIKENKILFDVSMDVYEDMLFVFTALNYSKVVSTLADKDYYYLVQHESTHLSKKPIPLNRRFHVYFSGLEVWFTNNIDIKLKTKIYNAFLIRCVESFRDVVNKNPDMDDSLFQLLSSYFNIHKELFDLSLIYDNEKQLTLLFLSGEYKYFKIITRELKRLKPIEKKLKDEVANINGFDKIWIHKNKLIVVDFNRNENKVAFDIELHEQKKVCEIWMLSRSDPKSLEKFENDVIKKSKKRYLIAIVTMNNTKEIIDNIISWLNKI